MRVKKKTHGFCAQNELQDLRKIPSECETPNTERSPCRFLQPSEMRPTARTKHVPCSAAGKFVFRLAVVLLVLSGTIALADGQGKTIAVYGHAAVAKTPTPGWSFLWNASGKVGDSKGYSPLSYIEKSRAYGVMDENGALNPNAPSHNISRDFLYLDISGMRDKEGIARFYIASYTLTEDPEGEVWINNGNMRNLALRNITALEIYVNDELKSQSFFKQDRIAAVFQQNLGHLKKGDTIRIAVGPGENSPRGDGRLFFMIEEYPAGQKPAAPINILSPPPNMPNPQFGADGKIRPSYAAMHKKQCEALLTNNPELVFIGDSITVRWPAELLNEKFGAFRPANLGMAGDGFQHVLWRLQNGIPEIHPKVIVLLICTNNITARQTPDEIAQGIGSLLKAIQEKTPASKILLLGILPRGESSKEETNEKIRQTNAKLALLADKRLVFYLDVGDKLVEPDGTISNDVMPDKLHVAMPGYIRWMDAMKPTLDTLLSNP